MTNVLRRILAALAVVLIAAPAFAQEQRSAVRSFTQAELDQMLAPVALYPDPLLSQVLMAATYPRDVLEAAEWSRANPGLQGDDAVRAAQGEDWDPSVKSLAAFPQLLARMDEKLDWTRDLGDAFLAQEAQVMDTVQQLRRRAQAAGNLQSGEQLYVREQGQAILVQPTNARTLYVPYYDPMLVYGSWWWPAHPPVAWSPWLGYARPYHTGLWTGFWWGTPVSLSVNFFFGNFDWHRRHVHVVQVNNYYYLPPVVVNRTVVTVPGRWQHHPHHRRDVAFRDASVRERFAAFRQQRVQDRNARPQAQPVTERRAERQAAPAQQIAPVQPTAPALQTAPAQTRAAVQPQRDDRRAERQALMRMQQEARQQARQQVRELRERPHALPAVQPQAPPAAQAQARMPAAAKPPQEPKRHEARDHGKRGNGRS